MEIDRERLFLKLTKENGFVTDDDVARAKDHKRRKLASGVDIGLGAALLDIEAINKTQYLTVQRAAFYKIQRSWDKRLARVIIESDYAPKQQMLEIMAFQKEHYTREGVCRRGGDLLIERGILTVEQLKAAEKILALKG